MVGFSASSGCWRRRRRRQWPACVCFFHVAFWAVGFCVASAAARACVYINYGARGSESVSRTRNALANDWMPVYFQTTTAARLNCAMGSSGRRSCSLRGYAILCMFVSHVSPLGSRTVRPGRRHSSHERRTRFRGGRGMGLLTPHLISSGVVDEITRMVDEITLVASNLLAATSSVRHRIEHCLNNRTGKFSGHLNVGASFVRSCVTNFVRLQCAVGLRVFVASAPKVCDSISPATLFVVEFRVGFGAQPRVHFGSAAGMGGQCYHTVSASPPQNREN